jgi:hypothetical protein
MTFEIKTSQTVRVMLCDNNDDSAAISVTSLSLIKYAIPSPPPIPNKAASIPHCSKTFTLNEIQYCSQCDSGFTFDDNFVCVYQVLYCFKYKNGLCSSCIS